MATFGFFGGADPFRELRRLQSEMDRVMGALSGPGQLAAAGVFPAVNVYAGQGGIAVVAELPGVDKDDLEIQAHHDTLTLHGTRRPPSERREAYTIGGRGGAARSAAAFSFLTGSIPVASKRTSRTACCG